jgi:hypothetical protein
LAPLRIWRGPHEPLLPPERLRLRLLFAPSPVQVTVIVPVPSTAARVCVL